MSRRVTKKVDIFMFEKERERPYCCFQGCVILRAQLTIRSYTAGRKKKITKRERGSIREKMSIMSRQAVKGRKRR